MRYFRDIDGREVDFVLTQARQPVGFVKVKWDDAKISPSLRYLSQRFLGVLAWQVSAAGNKDYLSPDRIRHRLHRTLAEPPEGQPVRISVGRILPENVSDVHAEFIVVEPN